MLTVIRRRNEKSRSRETVEKWRFDLRKAILKQASLRGIHLENAVLDDAHLERAFLMDAHFENASLERAHFEGANLGGAHLLGTRLGGANFEQASLQDTDFKGAFLWGANFGKADLWGAHLEEAKLRGANFEGAYLGRAHLERADLQRANLERTEHLTQHQLNGAHGSNVKLPPGYKINASQSYAPLNLPEPEGFPVGYHPPDHLKEVRQETASSISAMALLDRIKAARLHRTQSPASSTE